MAEGGGNKNILFDKIKKLYSEKIRCRITTSVNNCGPFTGRILRHDDEFVLFEDKFGVEVPIRISVITAIQEMEEGV